MSDQFLTPSPKKMLRMMASRSMAIDIARRKSRLENHPYFTGSAYGAPTGLLPPGCFTVLRLNQKKLLVSAAPRS
jgi:hypothetical protein